MLADDKDDETFEAVEGEFCRNEAELRQKNSALKVEAPIKTRLRVAMPFVAQRLADIRGQTLERVQCHKDGASALMAEFAEAL